MPEALDPLNLPLHGSQLIEASAGTGKTWTIAALYLRLVLGHGGEGHGFARPLVPAEILVMTFTKAATRELSDRIRNRLVEAACCFRGEAEPRPDDTFLANLLQAYPEGLLREAAAWRLAMAAEAMDDAAVYTIDAWCQRMLHEHAFDSGCLFDEELEANEGAMLAEAARDYWRQEIYPLSDAALAIAMNQWKDVDALRKDVLPLIDMPLPPGAGQGSLEACMAGAGAQRARTLTALKSGWPARADAMLAWLEGQWSSKNCAIDKRVLARAHCTRWIQDLKSWALSEIAELPALGRGAQRLTRAAVLGAVQPGFVVDIPDAFEAFEALFVAFQSLPDPATALRAHAAARVAERMQHLKQQAGAFGFSDMLERLHEALDEATHGAQARRLRQRIVDQYPVALVDEFQDTSPVQLGIFDRLYRIADNDPVTALLLIGDPKQSIYGFRGADIYSYLGARRSTAGRHHALGTNHRSTEALVTAVNHLFRNAEQRPGAGAFLFRTDSQDGSLPFEEVAARGREQRLVTQAGQIPAITFVVDAALRGQPESRAVLAALCAERLVALLNDEGAGFAQEGKPFQRLQPADMAVLVRTGTEAHVLRQALHRRGVASVYLSDKDTVFKTQEALDLMRVLQAVAAPRDVRLARAALATALIGSTLEELLALSTEDALFDAQCELLQQLHVTWQTQGVLAMVRRALHGFGLPARLLGSGGSSAGVATDVPANGERRLTNVLHLAELLQAASAQAEGDQALIRWLAQQIEDSAAGLSAGDEQVLRLESDADLVKVVTVHKSKGLEYPLAFLPFAAHYRGVTRKNTAVVQRVDGAGRRWLALSPSEEDLQADDTERQREDLRLLYVALTRARHALWVGVSALKEGQGTECVWHRSAIGYLLSGPQARLPAQIAEDLRAVASRCPEIRVEPHASIDGSPMPSITRMAPREAPPALVAAIAYDARFDRNWSISSYSALVRDASRAPQAGASDVPMRVLRDDEPAEADGAPIDADRPGEQPWHHFPRGAFAGNFLHGQLEWLAGEGFALDADPSLQQALLRRCERQGWGHRSADVLGWLRQVCATPLPALGVPLADLGSCTPEMEFWFPSDGLRASGLDRLCRQYIQPGKARPELPERALRGMLMGFADLVFEHRGRYWVLDYKSNALGGKDADYTPAAMDAAMLEHRYDVQAVLYLLALHRLLRLRLGPAYDPARQLGGAIYFFLRGIHSGAAGCCHLTPPIALIETLDDMLARASETGSEETA